MKINQAGLQIIKDSESCRLHAYQDTSGIWTIGWGHTAGARKGLVCTQEQADRWLREDCEEAEQAVAKYVKITLNENQFSALVSFVYNLGGRQFKNSTLLKLININDIPQAAQQFQRWVMDAGVKQPGLVVRREKEKLLFLQTP